LSENRFPLFGAMRGTKPLPQTARRRKWTGQIAGETVKIAAGQGRKERANACQSPVSPRIRLK
jgi:hypothetical protein